MCAWVFCHYDGELEMMGAFYISWLLRFNTLKFEPLCRSLERKGCVLDCFHGALCLVGTRLVVCVRVKKGSFWFSQFKHDFPCICCSCSRDDRYGKSTELSRMLSGLLVFLCELEEYLYGRASSHLHM